VHPAQLTSVLYVVQRMNSLSATFLLAGLLLYCRLRAGSLDAGRGRWSLWLGVPALALLSVLSKENGVLLFAFAFVLEFCLFDFRCARAATRRELLRWHLAFVALPVVAAVAWVVLTVDFSGAPFPHRTFSAVERLLTETRVLWGYVAALFVPRPPDLALYYDDIVISRGLLSPPSTLFALLGALGLCAFALLARRRFPWFAFAVLWFLAGHLIESTVLPLEIAHLHRNYVPYIGPIAAAVVAVHQALQRRRPGLSRLAALAVVAGLGALTAQRADQWSDPFSLAMYEVAHRPESSRANYEAGRMYFIAYRASPTPELFDSARRAFERAMELDRDSIGPSIALLILRGGPNYIADDPVLGALRERLARRPLNPPEVHYLRSLIECQARPDCARPPNDMLEIFASALESPHTLPGPKADLLALMGLYYADALNDLPACIRTMRESVKMAPRDPNYRLNLAQALMVAGDWAAAEEALDEAETLDRLRAYAGRITALRADLAAMTAADG
jgi:tetratricopeptide (TPR) repeat protein